MVPPAAEAVSRTAGGAVHPADAGRALAVVERARELARGNVNPQLLVTALTQELRRALLGGAAATR